MAIFVPTVMILASIYGLLAATVIKTEDIQSGFFFRFIPGVLGVCLAISAYHMLVT